MSNETEEVPKTQEFQAVSEVVKKKVIPAVREHQEYLKISNPDEETKRFCKFTGEDFRVRAEKLSELHDLLEAFAENPKEFKFVDFRLHLEYLPVSGRWGGVKTILVLRRPGDPEPPEDSSNPQTEIGFMILRDIVPEEEKEELRKGLEYKSGMTPEKIIEIKEERLPGERVIFFAAGISRPRNEVKVNYYAGVQFSCSSVLELCFKPDGIVFIGSTPYQTPNPITENRMTRGEMETIKGFLSGLVGKGY